MNEEKLKELYDKMIQVHEKAESIYNKEGVPSMLKNEYRNKVSQYNDMYENCQDMKLMTSKQETIDNLLNQQAEILNVRIKWELDWAKRVIERL
jgi:aminoglycoside phosphotransferase family enzyme